MKAETPTTHKLEPLLHPDSNPGKKKSLWPLNNFGDFFPRLGDETLGTEYVTTTP